MKYQRLKITCPNGTETALVGRAWYDDGLNPGDYVMKKARESTEVQEPLGIIISCGERGEPRTIFSAYIWGPAPELVEDATAKVA